MTYGHEPEPPIKDSRIAVTIGCNIDGHDFGLVVLQWQPNAKKWCHSGMCATGHDIATNNWLYVAPCPMPE